MSALIVLRLDLVWECIGAHLSRPAFVVAVGGRRGRRGVGSVGLHENRKEGGESGKEEIFHPLQVSSSSLFRRYLLHHPTKKSKRRIIHHEYPFTAFQGVPDCVGLPGKLIMWHSSRARIPRMDRHSFCLLLSDVSTIPTLHCADISLRRTNEMRPLHQSPTPKRSWPSPSGGSRP